MVSRPRSTETAGQKGSGYAMRGHRERTELQLLVFFFVILFLLGGGLIAYFYGIGAAAAAFFCLFGALVFFLVLYGLLSLGQKWMGE